MSIIKVDNLTKDYGHNRGVFNVSFEISEGEAYGYLGPNGAGKTTTIRHLMGFSKPDSGKTYIFDQESFNNYDKLLKDIGYIPGEVSLPTGLTGWEFLDMMKKLRKMEDDTRLNELLELFEVDPSGDTKGMSFGNKRKLAIVTAFMHDPKVLILDEPTSGLDPVMQDIFIDFLKKEKARGKTILLSSHVFSEVEAVCDRISIIKHGRIVDEFPMAKIKYANDKVFKLTLSDQTQLKKIKEELITKEFIRIDKEIDNDIYVEVNDKDINLFIESINQFNIVDFSYEKLTLEEYFMQYYVDDIQFTGVSK